VGGQIGEKSLNKLTDVRFHSHHLSAETLVFLSQDEGVIGVLNGVGQVLGLQQEESPGASIGTYLTGPSVPGGYGGQQQPKRYVHRSRS